MSALKRWLEYFFAKNDPITLASTQDQEIELPDSVDGRDRVVILEKTSPETINPLVKRDASVEGIYEIVDKNFSYPLTAHVGLKFDSRSFSQVPQKQFDVKMKKVKVPSNYYALGGDGLDRRYVYGDSNDLANPNKLDLVFVVDLNMSYAARSLIKRNLKYFLSKLTAGYTNIRASVWEIKHGPSVVINEETGDTINNFTFRDTDEFFELETPGDNDAYSNDTNLYTKLIKLLDANVGQPVAPAQLDIVNFFLRKSQLSITDEVGKASEETVLKRVWQNTVRKIIYFSGSDPDSFSMVESTYQTLLNHARENCVQLYYLYTDAQFSGSRTLRELSRASGGGDFNLQHDADIKLKQFCDKNFQDSNKIYYGDWDGTFKIAWTDNPAWILYDIITDVNYGLGNFIDYKSIDKWTLYDIGRFCDAVDENGRFKGVQDGRGNLEPRYTCNIIFYNKDEAYKVLQDISAIFKGIVYWNTEGFSFAADMPKDPVLYFSNTNVKDGVFNYSETARNKRYTSVEVVYNDKLDGFKTKIELIEDVDGIRKYGINPFKINAAGCTSRSEARRIGRYVLCSSMFEADTVTFSAGLEGAYIQPGDVFCISDEVRNVAKTFGRVLTIDPFEAQIKIDGEFKDGLASGIYLQVASGNYSVSDLNQITGSDKQFTGTLEQIRARRQKQVRKFNISQVEDMPYGALLNLTGDFLLNTAKIDAYPLETRISGGGVITGETSLASQIYKFPEHTVINGNPRWDSVSYQNVVDAFSAEDVDITFSGIAGTGQVIGNEANWTGEIRYRISEDSSFLINNASINTVTTNVIRALRLNTDGTVAATADLTQSDLQSLLSLSFYQNGSDGQIFIIYSRGAVLNNNFSPSANWATTFAATEIYTVGKNFASDATAFYGYAAVFIKGGSRILERASKGKSDYGNIKFTYRDLLAFSRLKPFYTIAQADVGNRQESSFEEWQPNRKYSIGNRIKVTTNGTSIPYICLREHDSSEDFAIDFTEPFTRQCNIQANNKNLGLTTQDAAQVAGISIGMRVSGAGIPANTTVTNVGNNPASVTVSISNDPTATANNVAVTFSWASVKWQKGNNQGYSTIGFPKDFYGKSKIYLNQTPTFENFIKPAFESLGIDIFSGTGPLGSTDISSLPELSGLGFSGLVYGTGYPVGFYDLVVDTSLKNIDQIAEGSMYVLSGSGVEPKVYKTIAVKEEEANIYSVVGIEHLQDKHNFVEKDMINTAPSVFVQSPFDIVIKPQPPASIATPTLALNGSNIPTGINISWTASPTSPIAGYRIYVSRPDYSTTVESDSITEGYTTSSSTTSLTVPVRGIFGQYDISVYAQGQLYKLLSDGAVEASVWALPPGTLSGPNGGPTVNATLVSGFTIDTADTASLSYVISGNSHAGTGYGNFTSENLTFKWKYIDPTGGVIDTVEKILENPFIDLPPKVSVQVVNELGEPLTEEENNYSTFSYTITKEQNKRIISRGRSPENIQPSRNLGLRVRVTDNTNITKTGTFFARNIAPSFEKIDVIDGYQFSPYYILSGYYGHSSLTGIAVWNSGSDLEISGSGLRNYSNGQLLRSEDSSREISFFDISGAFKSATGFDLKIGNPLAPIKGVNINYRGQSDYDYIAYAHSYQDLIDHYNRDIRPQGTLLEDWAKLHWTLFGQSENRTLPRISPNPLGFSNLSQITAPNKTGFSGVTFTILTDDIVKDEIVFNCFSTNSNKDVLSVDIFTGDSAAFEPDTEKLTNLYNYIALNETRNYINIIRLSEGIEEKKWYFFRFRPWDDFGEGYISDVVSGYLEKNPADVTESVFVRKQVNGGRNINSVTQIPDTANFIKDFKYKIKALGTNVNWSSIGVIDEPAVDVEFIYNGNTVSGTGGQVARVEIPIQLNQSDLDTILLITAFSDSTLVLPATATPGTKVIIINDRSANLNHNIYVRRSSGEDLSIITAGGRAEIIRADDDWIDPRESSLQI